MAMVAQVMKLINPGGFVYDSLLLSAGIAMQFALAFYLEWLSSIGWSDKKPAGGVAQAARTSFGMRPVAVRTGP